MDATTDARIGELMRAALDRRGMPQWQLARCLQRDPAQVSRWLSGRQSVPVRCLIRAARILRAPELLEVHPVARALAELRAQRVVDLDAWRAVAAQAGPRRVRLEGLVHPDGRLEVWPVGDGPEPDPGSPAPAARTAREAA